MKFSPFFCLLLSFFTVNSQISLDWSEPSENGNLEIVRDYLGAVNNNFCWIRSKGKKYNIDFINPKSNETKSINFELKNVNSKLIYLGGIAFNNKALIFATKKGNKKTGNTIFIAKVTDESSSVIWTGFHKTSYFSLLVNTLEIFDFERKRASNCSINNNHLTFKIFNTFLVINEKFEVINEYDFSNDWKKNTHYSASFSTNSKGELFVLSEDFLGDYYIKQRKYTLHKIANSKTKNSNFKESQSFYKNAEINIDELDKVTIVGRRLKASTNIPEFIFGVINDVSLDFVSLESQPLSFDHLLKDSEDFKKLCRFQAISTSAREKDTVLINYQLKETFIYNQERTIILEGYSLFSSDNINKKQFFLNIIILRINKENKIESVTRLPITNYVNGNGAFSSVQIFKEEDVLYFLHNFDLKQTHGSYLVTKKILKKIMITKLTENNNHITKTLEKGDEIIDISKPIEINGQSYVLKVFKRLNQDVLGKKIYTIGKINLG